MHIHFPGCLHADLKKMYESKRSAGLPATPTSSCCAQGVLTVPLKSSMVSACMAVALGQSQTVMECHYNIQPFLMTPEWMALVATWLKGHGEGICAVWNPSKMAKNMKGQYLGLFCSWIVSWYQTSLHKAPSWSATKWHVMNISYHVYTLYTDRLKQHIMIMSALDFLIRQFWEQRTVFFLFPQQPDM